jgi:hypothetical protein
MVPRRMIASPLVIGGKASIQLCRMLDNLALAPGDVLTVTRLDRLARSTFDLSVSSSASWTRMRNSDPWRNRGPTAPAAPGG